MRRPSDLQIQYQRNMLIAQFCLMTCAVITGLFLSLPSSDSKSIISQVHSVQNLHLSENVNMSEPIAAKLSFVIKEYTGQLSGFLGFVNLNPIKDISQAITIVPPIYKTDSEIDIPDESQLSFSIDEGDDVGIYIPDGTEFLYNKKTVIKLTGPFNRNVQVLKRIKPQYPLVARNGRKEGEISTLVYIDSEGFLSTFPDWISDEGVETIEYIINGQSHIAQYAYIEEPEGWFFAEKFLQVLFDWRFSPKIEDGKAVGSLLRIKSNFCINVANCAALELEEVTVRDRKAFQADSK